MAVKTILVGLGSFGHDVCNLIAERIEAETGSLDRVPWVRFVVYETEQNTTSYLAHKGLVRHLVIDPTTWNGYMGNPGNYDPAIKFTEWANDEIRAAMREGGTPTTGANNVRPTGRLCFLDQKNSTDFEAAVTKQIHELRNLRLEDALKQMGIKEAKLQFAKVGEGGDDSIQVYVIGSLAGGTCSGSFIDVGYFIRTLQGLGNTVEVDGIFVIPHASYTNQVHWANVYAALTELNHFVGGKPYAAKFPSRPNPTEQYIPPFRRTFILQSGSGMAQESYSLEPLQSAVADYLYLYSVIDPEAKLKFEDLMLYMGERDHDGRPMGYLSFGASAVMFPVRHVIDGLSARLGGEAIESITERRSAGTGDVNELASKLKVTPESYRERMLNHPKVQDYLVRLGEATAAAASDALKGNPSARDNIRVRISNGLATSSTGHDQNFQGEFRAPIEDVTRDLSHERLKQLDEHVLAAIERPSQGAYFASSLLSDFIAKSNARLKDLENPSTEIGVRAEAQSSLDRATILEQRLSNLKKGCNPFAKREDPKALSREWTNVMNEYWSASFIIRSEEFEKGVLSELIQRAELLHTRLTHPENGLTQFLEDIRRDLFATFEKKNKQGPPINGLCLFTPHKTLPEEWSKCLPNPEEVKRARTQILQQCRALFGDLFKDRTLSSFDRPKRKGWREVEEIIHHGRPVFALVARDPIESRLAAWPNWESELRGVLQKGSAFIRVDYSRNQLGTPHRAETGRRQTRVYFHDPKATEGGSGEINRVISRESLPLSGMPDRHSILITEGLGAFSLYSVEGVPSAEPRYTKKNRTRSDIAWQKLNGQPLDERERFQIGLILAALALNVATITPEKAIGFVRRSTTFDNGGPFQLCNNGDLADASYHLGQNQLAAEDLKTQVEQRIRQEGLPATAAAVNRFNSGVEEIGISIGFTSQGAVKITKREAFLRGLEFLRTIPGLVQAVIAYYPDFDANTTNAVLAPESADRPASYRCNRPNCGQFLALANSGPPVLPEVCPNPDCRQQIRFDKLLGL